jgi:hypothetical protein
MIIHRETSTAWLAPSEPARRYSRTRAGDLVHFDTKKLAPSGASVLPSPAIGAAKQNRRLGARARGGR